MRWRRSRWALLAVTGCVIAGPAIGRAESKAHANSGISSTQEHARSLQEHARELAKEAEAAAKAGHPSEAAGLYQSAWRLHRYWDYICKAALLESQHAQSQHAQAQRGRYLEAAAALTTCEREMPGDLRESLGVEVGLRLKHVLPHVASVDITANVSGAEVLVDGRVADTLPLDQPLFVEPGKRDIVVRKPRYHDDQRRVELQDGSFSHFSITLYPVINPSAQTFSERPMADSFVASGASEGNESTPEDKSTTRARRIVVGVGLGISVGSSTLGVGLGFGAIAQREYATRMEVTMRRQDPSLACTTSRLSGCKDYKSTADSADALAIGSVVSLAVASVGVLMALYPHILVGRNGEEPAVEAVVAPAPGGGAFVVRGRF